MRRHGLLHTIDVYKRQAQHPAGSTSDADTTSRSVSLESGLGANDEIHGCTVVPCESADGSVGAHQQADVAAPHADAAGRSAESGAASGADDRTGWEAEREFFFSAQNQTSQTASADVYKRQVFSREHFIFDTQQVFFFLA